MTADTVLVREDTRAKRILREHVSKVASLSKDQFDYFYSRFRPQRYRKGQMIIREGDRVSCEYFVLDGYLKSFYINEDMRMFILQFAMTASWISDYNALYDGTRATTNLDCITDVELLCLSSEDKEELCQEIGQLELFFRWRINRDYVAAQKRLLSFMSDDTRHRYEELITQYPQLHNIVPKHLIAAYLGVSRETISRLYHV
ncbi:MAG: Crp/Fnr family transcriptional regulator [Bacteroidetes bacterium]|nr:Crp/Fnr family transcriptional regulator [Bacteroidota bacterium]